jgi:hypothetical protein
MSDEGSNAGEVEKGPSIGIYEGERYIFLIQVIKISSDTGVEKTHFQMEIFMKGCM